MKVIKIVYLVLIFCSSWIFVFSDLPLDDDFVIIRKISSKDISIGDNVSVLLNVSLDVNYEHYSYAIEETIPIGWEVIDGGDAIINGNTLKWFKLSESNFSESFILTYVLIASGNSGEYIFNGEYVIDGMDKTEVISGNSSINVLGTNETSETNDDDNNNNDNNSPLSSKKSKKKSGGGSSFYIPPVLECEENFECTDWSACKNSLQTRTCTDINGCLNTTKESRICKVSNTNYENALLNFKTVNLKEVDKNKRYKGNFVGTEEYVVFDRNDTPDYILLVNEETGKEYFSRAIDEVEGKRVYSIEKIDENILESGILVEQGLVEVPITTQFRKSVSNLYNNQLIMKIATIMFIFVLVCCAFASYFIIKSTHRKKAYNAILNKNNQEFLDKRFNSQRVDEMKEQVKELTEYVNKQTGKDDSDLKLELLKAGWNIDIIEEVLKNREI